MGEFVVAVDVGTGSARAGIYDRQGRLLARASHPIAIRRRGSLAAEHSSGDVWAAVKISVKTALASAAIPPESVAAIGFDATCSLTVLDANGRSLGVAGDGDMRWDTISWLDHRAVAEAEALTNAGGSALLYAGGSISPEMQLPKLMWLKKHLPEVWEKAGMMMDLADFLTWKATGNLTRSVCTLTAKWGYLNHEAEGWDHAFLEKAGLSDLRAKAGIDRKPATTGASLGTLTANAAGQLGLHTGCIVAAGMVDAYAGMLALTGGEPDNDSIAGLIGGTSSCVMRFSPEPQFIPSFWGPYLGVGLESHWITEGGQSATGALLDHIIRSQGGGLDVSVETHQAVLDRIAILVAEKPDQFGRDIHILPDYNGNRSPLGDAHALGAIQGLTLDSSFDALCAIYYRAMVSVALGMRQILDLMEEEHKPLSLLHLGGGHTRNPLLTQLYADASRRPVAISAGDEAMLLGSAMTAATAAGWYKSLTESCAAMKRPATILQPDETRATALDRDYRIFLRMQEHRRELADLKAG